MTLDEHNAYWQAEVEVADPEELLAAAKRYGAYSDRTAVELLDIGFKLARPGGWKHVARLWLREYRKDAGE